MESFEETSKGSSSKKGFFKYVFNFDEDSKSDLMNITQYALLAIIPIIVLNKISQKYVPEANEEKGTFEILAEVISQVLLIFFGLFLINRIVTYLPTYSGEKYPEVNIIYIILTVLMITLSLQTKLGEKVSILSDRVIELWDGGKNDKNNQNAKKTSGNVKVSQPISGQAPMLNQINALSQSLYSGNNGGQTNSTPINQLPNVNPPEQTTDYNSMYRNDFNPLQGAATPGGNSESFGPMAANDAFGGAFGGSFGTGF
jgi:hypothetical protein